MKKGVSVPLYAAKDLKKGKKAKPVGFMRNPDLPGCVVDRKTFEKLYGVKFPKCGLSGLKDGRGLAASFVF